MPVKTEYGEQLNSIELAERIREFDMCASVLERWARKKLTKKGIKVFSVNAKQAICIDCPEYPSECYLCKMDANMDEAHRKVALEIIVVEA